eukprot:UC1_evm3s1021
MHSTTKFSDPPPHLRQQRDTVDGDDSETHWLSLTYERVVDGILLRILKIVVAALNWHINGFWAWVQREHWLGNPRVHGPDSRQNLEGVAGITQERYGEHRDEQMHVIAPSSDQNAARDRELKEGTRSDNGAIFYVHGGGFVIASSEVLLHSVTHFCRDGFTVYSIDYPLAPSDPYPAAVVSTLRALAYLRTQRGIERISLLGDSAGAALTCMAAAYISNPDMLKDFSVQAGDASLIDMRFPEIEHSAALYGLLDADSWRRRLPTIGWLENAIAVRGVGACVFAYRNRKRAANNQHPDRQLFLDMPIERIQTLPKTLFIGATRDPLVFSSLLAHANLCALGHDVHCRLFPGRHGYFGLPPQWTLGAWRTDAAPTAILLSSFFKRGAIEDIGHVPPAAPPPTPRTRSRVQREARRGSKPNVNLSHLSVNEWLTKVNATPRG